MSLEQARKSQLELMAQETWPGERAFVLPQGQYGHFLYPGFKGRIIEDPSIAGHGKCLGGITDPGGIIYDDHQRKFIYGTTLKDRDKAMAALALEYKIHLMPSPEYVMGVTRRLCETLRDNPELDEATAGFKVKLNDETTIGEQTLPLIVIYAMLGKDNAQMVLDTVYNLFPEHDRMGSGINPRDNRKVNNLIYWAQSGGDLKKEYRGFRHRNTRFTDTWSHFKGKEHELTDPSQNVTRKWLRVVVDSAVSIFRTTYPKKP